MAEETKPAPGKERDHSGVEERRKAGEDAAKDREAGAKKRRAAVKGGTLGGSWFVAGGSLVNLDHVFRIELPAADDASPVVTLTSFGGTVVQVTGDDVAEFYEETGLKAREPDPVDHTKAESVTDSGKIISPKDAAAALVPGRESRVPDDTHRANARGTDAETDAEVQARAGDAPIPPPRDTTGEVGADKLAELTEEEAAAVAAGQEAEAAKARGETVPEGDATGKPAAVKPATGAKAGKAAGKAGAKAGDGK